MQLIQRKTLLCQEGSSDKVYEVDLCQVGDDRYLVNFRYGRRGTTLKEGTKTASAVDLAKAEKLFNQLVNEKARKGYQDVSQPVATVTDEVAAETSETVTPETVAIPEAEDARAQRILACLQAEVDGSTARSRKTQWKIDRVIWRAGELQLRSAAPLLLQLIRQQLVTPLRRYSLAGALGQCGDETAIPTLEQLFRNSATPKHVQRIALEAIFKLSPTKRSQLQQELIQNLPAPFANLVRQGSIEALQSAVELWLEQQRSSEILDIFYQIDHEVTRSVLLNLLKTLPFRPPYFKPIRHILKIAEYRQDAGVFALLARRFEQEDAMYSTDSYGQYIDGQYIQFRSYHYDRENGRYRSQIHPDWKREQQSENPRFAYSSTTREYFLRRIWRTLRQLGKANATSYVPLATQFLLQYSDADAEAARESVYYSWDWSTYTRHETYRIEWDQFAGFLTFNHILYENSDRYELKLGNRAWRCKNAYKPGDPAPSNREEAFPHLWEQQPSFLLQLLLESRCSPVHEFASKALRVCSDFCQSINLEILIELLSKPYESTAKLGFELAQQRYNPSQPNLALILAIANCAYAPARAQAHAWISEQRDRYLQFEQLIASLVISSQADTRAFARQLLNTAILDEAMARSLVGRIIAALLTLDETQGTLANEASETVRMGFGTVLRSIGLEVILDLLRHPLPELQACGAQILLDHQTPAGQLPTGLIDALLDSPYEQIRVIGVRLFGQLPDERLIQQTQLLLTFATHEVPELREAIRSTIHRLAQNHPEFGQQFASLLLQVFLQPEPYEGVYNFIAQVLQEDVPNWMQEATQADTWDLLRVNVSAAQAVAGQVLQLRAEEWAETLETSAIAQLTHHEVQAVRQSGYQMLRQIVSRLRQSEPDLLNTVMVFDSRWDDARQFGFELFGELLQPEDFTPSVVVSICDCNDPNVRRFGRDLLTQCFKSQDGQSYLVKFSEHPATDMQLFASNYLEQYASNHPERLRELQPYFTRVLAQVNRSRVAKQRIFAFLETEAIKSEASAQVVAEILTRQSLSIAIRDKSWAIATLLKIQQTYPQIELPIQVKSVAVRA